MPQIRVLVPGPWWNDLCYDAPFHVASGVRVAAPMGRGVRVGICIGEYDKQPDIDVDVKEIYRVLDDKPVLNSEYLSAVTVVSKAFLCSRTEVLQTLLPSLFWKGDSFLPFSERNSSFEHQTEFCYRYNDMDRQNVYIERLIGLVGGGLCLFPENICAREFYKTLKGTILSERLVMWPTSGGTTALRAWNKVLSCENPVVIGGPEAAGAPVISPELIIIEDECNPAYNAQSALSRFSLRSFAAARARASGASVLLGGRLPSSRVFDSTGMDSTGLTGRDDTIWSGRKYKTRVVTVYGVPKVPFKGVRMPLAMSDTVLTETLRHVNAGRTVFWLLDRRGISSGLRCADCGNEVLCPRCGSSVIYEKGRLRCPVCSNKETYPSRCPSCGGVLLQGSLPGLESILSMAQKLLQGAPAYLWHMDSPSKVSEKKRIIKELKERGGLLVGSRSALSVLDFMSPSLICWLDADAEQRRADYSARFLAYSMFLESCTRGDSLREVIFQSRHPNQQCIKSIAAGWRYFWRNELKEREELGFPPISYLVEITLPENWESRMELIDELDEAGFFAMQSDEDALKLSVMTEHIAPLRRVLEKYFEIRNSRKGFPRIRVCLD